jgi:hypothetical protein
MGYYKIKNITNDLGKRHPKVNTVLTIDFKDLINSSAVKINPGFEITVETNYLPITAQKLRAEGLITVVEIDKNSYQKLLNSQEGKKNEKVVSTQQSKNIESDNKSKKYKEKSK